MPISVGYAQKDITPRLERPIFLAGFGQNRRAESVHDPLSVRVLALRAPGRLFALASCDLLGLGRIFCQEVERRVQAALPGAAVVVASTHTHHAPDTLGIWGPDDATRGVDPEYWEMLREAVPAAIQLAFEAAVPADMRCAAVTVPGLARNFRNPEILDQELACLQFCAPGSGHPILTWMDFPCHPEVLGPANPHITPDYPHFLRAEVEARSGAPCLFSAGALGGMMSPDVQDHSFAEAAAMGRTLAQAGLEALKKAPLWPIEQFEYARREVSIPLRSPLLEQGLASGLLRDAVLVNGSMCTEAGLLKIGPAWLAQIPGELLPRLGLTLKETMRQAGAAVPAILGLANDEIGYILPDEEYQYPADPFDPKEHYEETMSIGPNAGSLLLQALQALLNAGSPK